jgi:hypothetical protein
VIVEPNPSGLCMCGCGQITSISPKNDVHRGFVRGEHVRFIQNHHLRLANPAKRSSPSNPRNPWFNKSQGRWYILRRDGRPEAWARVILATKLKRDIGDDEDAHHINGDTTDDRPENLMALLRSDHARLHYKGIPRTKKSPNVS